MKKYEDAFFVNPENHTASWIYYNPDADSGGQYVENICDFEDVVLASKVTTDYKQFFEILKGFCKVELSDIGTRFYEPMEKLFNSNPDFTDCTKETMEALIKRVKEIMEQPVVSFPVAESEERKKKCSKLKPCPFCGSKIWKYKDFGDITFFKCLFCGCVVSFEECKSETEAIEHFNRRTNNAKTD